MNFYRRIPIRYRIALGLVGMMAGVILVAEALQLLPNEKRQLLKSRAQFCETLAISGTTMVSTGDLDALTVTMKSIKRRNPAIVSVGFRREDSLVVLAGDHETAWDPSLANGETQMRVPIFRQGERWGTLEVAFVSINELLGWRRYALFGFVAFVVIVCFIQFSFFLRKTLDSLDPNGAVPKTVRDVLNSFAEGMILIDGSNRILFANRRVAEATGLDAEELVGRRIDSLPWCQDNEDDELPWDQANRTGQHVLEKVIRLRRDPGDGERRMLTFTVNCNAFPGRGVMATLDDITEIDETKAKLAVALGAAKDANEAKSVFLANMSHEIRTPLNAVLGFTDVLRRGLVSDSDEAIDHLNMIHRSGAHLLSLINDILDLSKIEAGKMDVESIPTSIVDALLEATQVQSARANEKDIDLSVALLTDIPESIQSDPTRLRQIITNLVGNAIKFTEKGSVRVRAECEPAPNGGTLRIHVQDTGIGMTPQQQEKIFESFVQADSSTTRKFGGTGLGLSISRRLAQAMGGELTVQSVAGEGSTFTVSLTVSQNDLERQISPSEVDALAAKRKRSRSGQLLQLAKGPILVVDDGASNRRLIDLVLSRAGAEVTCACNGLEAIQEMAKQQFGLVFMDMQMPVLDGMTATQKLREVGCTTPIVALTGNAMKGDREKYLAGGCSDFLSKPVNLDQLLQCAAKYIGTDTTDAEFHETLLGTNSDVLTHLDASSAKSTQDSPSSVGGPIHSLLPMDDDDFRAVVIGFVDRLEDRLDQIEQAISRQEFETVQQDAHWLKGSGGTVGFPDFGPPAAQLERAAKDSDAELAADIFRQIKDIHSRIVVPTIASDEAAHPLVADPTETPVLESSVTGDDDQPIHCTLPFDDDEYLEIVSDFIVRLDQRLNIMRQLLDDQSYEELSNEAHWLKGAGGTVGYLEMTAPATELLQASRDQAFDRCQRALDAVMSVRKRMVVPEKVS